MRREPVKFHLGQEKRAALTYPVFLSVLWVVWQSTKVYLAAKIIKIPLLLWDTEKQEFTMATLNLLNKLGKLYTCLLPQFPISNNCKELKFVTVICN